MRELRPGHALPLPQPRAFRALVYPGTQRATGNSRSVFPVPEAVLQMYNLRKAGVEGDRDGCSSADGFLQP